MTASITPTILTSRVIPGLVPSTRLGNVAWNDDGQCLLLTNKDVTVMSPFMVSSLPPPPTLVDPHLVIESATAAVNKGQKAFDAAKAEPDDDMDEAPQAGGSSDVKPEVKKLKDGELQWWQNDVEIAPHTRKDTRYGWEGVEGDSDKILRDEDIRPRQAVWSPSGLSDVGGCVLAMLTSSGQVSIYSPRGDPVKTIWEEIADLTRITRSVIRPKVPDGRSVTVDQLREMQTTYLAWCPALPLEEAIGIDGSLLATSDRACRITLWSYGPERRFHEVSIFPAANAWVSNMAWSDWREVDPHTCESNLAFTTSTGSLGSIGVRQTVMLSPEGSKKIVTTTSKTTIIDHGDKRQISALNWSNDMLVWAKPGSVHLWNDYKEEYPWKGVQTIVLERIGNWAGCNAIAACIGISRISKSSIAIVLSTLTIHIVHGLDTMPKLASTGECLVASLAARQAFLDHALGDFASTNKSTFIAGELEQMTAYTAGWADPDWAGMATVNMECINFHNLDSANEGKRFTAFAVFDMTSSLPGLLLPAVDKLREVVDTPINPLIRSPIRQLLPHLLRLLGDPPDQIGISELLEICDVSETITQDIGTKGLVVSMYGDTGLNALRAKYALSLWFGRLYPTLDKEFAGRRQVLLETIARTCLLILARHLVSLRIQNLIEPSLDHRFIRTIIQSLRRVVPSIDILERLVEICPPSQSAETSTADLCPACRQPVDEGDLVGVSRCTKGHEWTRCSITGSLITTPEYRTCTTCPAISLLPSRIRSPQIAVDEEGLDKDHERFKRPIPKGQEIVQQVLESCQSCILCGGRWIRAI